MNDVSHIQINFEHDSDAILLVESSPMHMDRTVYFSSALTIVVEKECIRKDGEIRARISEACKPLEYITRCVSSSHYLPMIQQIFLNIPHRRTEGAEKKKNSVNQKPS